MHKIDAWVLSNFISIVKWLDVFRRKTIEPLSIFYKISYEFYVCI